MNAFYGESPGLRVPEIIELFANKNLKALTRHLLASPQQFAFLLDFTRDQWRFGNDAQRVRYKEFLVPIVDKYVSGANPLDWTALISAAGLQAETGSGATALTVVPKPNGGQKRLLDKLGYNNWRKLSSKQ